MNKNKTLILFKASCINNMLKITKKYCDKHKDKIDYYFLIADEDINDSYIFANNIIYFKIKEDNWSSLLIKVIKAFDIFKNKNYKHIIVSNVNTFLNIPLLLNTLDKDINCLSSIGYNYKFKNIVYNWPSGAFYVFNIKIVNKICDFFNEGKYIISNKLTTNFIQYFPTTDDIFFGYFFHLNNIKIKNLQRLDILNDNYIITKHDKKFIQIRVKTGKYDVDLNYYNKLYKQIYN